MPNPVSLVLRHCIQLKAVELDLVFLGNLILNKKLHHILPLIALELDDLPQLLIFYNVSVAAKLFLESLQDLLVIKALLQTLRSRKAHLLRFRKNEVEIPVVYSRRRT